MSVTSRQVRPSFRSVRHTPSRPVLSFLPLCQLDTVGQPGNPVTCFFFFKELRIRPWFLSCKKEEEEKVEEEGEEVEEEEEEEEKEEEEEEEEEDGDI